MIDLQLKLATAAALAWLLTRHVTPASARHAHRLWLVVIHSPVLWLAGSSLISPLMTAQIRNGVMPESIVNPTPAAQTVLLWIYVGVAALLAARLVWGIRSVRQLVRGSRRLDASERARLPMAAGGFDVRVSGLDLPVTAGFFKPVILLPRDWRSLPAAALEAILRHEAAHVRRKDCLVGLLCAFAETLLWFNPIIWMAGSRIRWFAEMACDHEAAVSMRTETYASELLTLAAGWRAARAPIHAITAGAGTAVARRIDLLLHEVERGRQPTVVLSLAGAVLLAAIPLASAVRLGGVSASHPPASAAAGHAALHQLRHGH